MSNHFDDVNNHPWQRAARRDLRLHQLLNASGWKGTREAVEAADSAFGVSALTVRRMIDRFFETRRASSLLTQCEGTPVSAKRVGEKIEPVTTPTFPGCLALFVGFLRFNLFGLEMVVARQVLR
jgi:hypothetical protein